jgi:hypothetical protein
MMGSLGGSSSSWMMTRPLPASSCLNTLKRKLGGSSTSTSLGTRENIEMTRALPVVSWMLKRVRVPALPQNCSVLALLHLNIACAAAELEPRALAVLGIDCRKVGLYSAEHVCPVVAVALGQCVHEEPDERHEGLALGSAGRADGAATSAVRLLADAKLNRVCTTPAQRRKLPTACRPQLPASTLAVYTGAT